MNSRTAQQLRSQRPSERSKALDELRKSATISDLGVLRTAALSEPVPMLRRQITMLIRSLTAATEQAAELVHTPEATESQSDRLEENFVHWMRHELEPGIGWLELAASDDVHDYETSETCAALNALRDRLDSVEALVRASAPPRFELLSLSELVAGSAKNSGAPEHRLSVDQESSYNDNITTDARLLRLILSNAIRNAWDAVAAVPDETAQVYVTYGTLSTSFWVRVSNQFEGAEFKLDDVSGEGVSAKIGHQGQGFSIMRIVAARLGYQLSMEAESGFAVFMLKGPRRRSG